MGTFHLSGATARARRPASGSFSALKIQSIAKAAVSALAVLGLGLSAPARAEDGAGEAEKLRRLDIMLMVTSLRCRTTEDNFQDEYVRFEGGHLTELNKANADLRSQFARQLGAKEADRALDRMSTVMANQYGGGHPWLTCHQLHEVAVSLALVKGHDTLVEAAGQLLERQPQPLLALAGR